MSFINLNKGAAPSAPSSNLGSVYMDTTDNRLKFIDYNGVINILTNDGMQDRNTITNGGMIIQQRVATASTAIPSVSTTTRAGQVADRWAVTTGNATTTSWAQIDTQGSIETGLESRYYGKITQATNAAKFIFSQFIINSEMAHLRGKKVRVSCKVKTFVGSNQTYKLGLLQLTAAGTVDVCPAFSSAIGASGVNPTWGTNLATISPDASPTGENGTINGAYLEITSTAAWVRSSCVFTIPTDAKNLCVVLIKDATGGTTDSTGVAEFQMTQGPEIVDYVEPPMSETYERCARFFAKSFPLTVVPAASVAVATGGNGATNTITRAAATALASYINIQFPIKMFKTPTLTQFGVTGAGAVPWRISGAASAAQTVSAVTGLLDTGAVVSSTGDAAGVVGDLVAVHYTADAEFVA